jgi:hypothetical protein
MLFLVGVLGLLALFSYGLPSVHAFFEPPPARTAKRTPSRVATPWGPRRSVSAKRAKPVGTAEFWKAIEARSKRDPMVSAVTPRDDTSTPSHGWDQLWIPADLFTGPWAPRGEHAHGAPLNTRRNPFEGLPSDAGPF